MTLDLNEDEDITFSPLSNDTISSVAITMVHLDIYITLKWCCQIKSR